MTKNEKLFIKWLLIWTALLFCGVGGLFIRWLWLGWIVVGAGIVIAKAWKTT